MHAIALLMTLTGAVVSTDELVLQPPAASAQAPVPSTLTVGGGFHFPDLAALYASYRPETHISLETMVTLGSLLGGVAGHLPLGQGPELLAIAMGGYRHNAFRVSAPTFAAPVGPRGFFGVGFANISDIEIRMVAGLAVMPDAAKPRHAAVMPEGHVLLGVPL